MLQLCVYVIKKIQKKIVVKSLGSFICAYQTDFNVSSTVEHYYQVLKVEKR